MKKLRNCVFKFKSKMGGWLAHRGGGGRRSISLVISADQTSQYNISTAAGSPTSVCDILLTINSAVVLKAGLVTGIIPAGSTLKIINNGSIIGIGGAGGSGGSVTSLAALDGSPGGAGGDAISLAINVTIDNTNGSIFGGGGGGGGGGAAASTNPPLDNASAGGCGAGGGAGWNNASGGNGGSGRFSDGGGTFTSAPGTSGSSGGAGTGGSGGNFDTYFDTGGNGGNGGDFGVAGGTGGDGVPNTSAHPNTVAGLGGIGGPAGFAVRLAGHTCTFLGGNNGTQVKGLVA